MIAAADAVDVLMDAGAYGNHSTGVMFTVARCRRVHLTIRPWRNRFRTKVYLLAAVAAGVTV